ncbi:uncharacterized protein LOC103723564 [Phoenix dactylifera]|uniref:Uncharacterized protein LOC103723564 n=1 Tax=Phoenix dactylifera TaxID=42345 RepID=A0A8B7D444_PHODC|nr:uncharacterized protein LOC103723564 [Phoenix dactylifera]
MEGQQARKMRISFKNATIVVCFINLIAALLLLQGFVGVSNRRSAGARQFDAAQLRYILESEEIRRAMEPVELIKRIKEIEQEAFNESATEIQQVPKQTAAVGLSKRLKDLRAMNDANSQKALEEWRKRKMERARQREIEKNGTVTSQV